MLTVASVSGRYHHTNEDAAHSHCDDAAPRYRATLHLQLLGASLLLCSSRNAFVPTEQMSRALLINDVAPDFEAETQLGPIKFSEYAKDSWVILFSHPRDFTPVCTTELARAAQLQEEFARRGVKMLALSCDDVESHNSWVQDVGAYGKTEVKYPIIADPERKIAKLYNMLPAADPGRDNMPFTVRSVFIIDSSRRIRAMVTYPAPIGRNFDELLRVVDALQTSDRLHCATPVDWKPGSRVIVPSNVPDALVQKHFADGLEVVDLPSKKSYLRYGSTSPS